MSLYDCTNYTEELYFHKALLIQLLPFTRAGLSGQEDPARAASEGEHLKGRLIKPLKE